MSQAKLILAENLSDHPHQGHVRTGACQMDMHLGKIERNRDACLLWMERAAGAGVRLLVFPECTLTGYAFPDAKAAETNAVQSEAVLDPIVDACRQFDMAVRYHKTHLPHLGADRWVCAGSGPLEPTPVQGLQTGVLICYDASFPEASRALALKGAELIALPTNWPAQAVHKAQWLPNTRAYENVVYFMTVNRVGKESGFTFPGTSRICSPKGLTLVEGPQHEEALLIADLDPQEARTKKIVRGDDYWVDRIADRRPELYTEETPG